MKLIDADALIEKLKQHHDFFVNAWGGFMGMPIQDKARCDELSNIIAEIINAPSIDIVRCRECKHHHRTERGLIYCDRITYGFGHTDVDFCSYGERKESE